MTGFFLSQLTPIELDELLSADLDGEFDAAALELGHEPDKVRTAITESPSALARRAELACAMVASRSDDALQIDELSRHRLTQAALARAGLRSSRSLPLASIGVAAAIALGVVVAVSRNDSKPTEYAAKVPSTSAAISRSSLAPTKPPPSTPQIAAIAGLPSIGSVATEQGIRQGLAHLVESSRGASTTATTLVSSPLIACLDSLSLPLATTGRIALAVASFRGDSVTVVAADVGNVRHLWLIREADCTIVFTLLA